MFSRILEMTCYFVFSIIAAFLFGALVAGVSHYIGDASRDAANVAGNLASVCLFVALLATGRPLPRAS